MKKVTVTLSMLVISIGMTFAANHSNEDSEKNKKDSAESKKVETTFSTDYQADAQTLEVSFSGIQDPFASISITNNRGSALQCSFIQHENGTLIFDLTSLQDGIYNVMLITDQEIRIKRFTVGNEK
jgi:Zn-dependent metalloprotease